MTGDADFAIDIVQSLDCRYAPQPWAFASEHGAAIDRHWDAAVRQRPHLFDGRVLLQTRGAVERGPDATTVFRATYTDVAFRAFLAWRDFGFPGRGCRNGFGMAALETADGAFVLGEMGRHTANAGKVYFPSGTPDPSDIVDGEVDIVGSIRRELVEETGLDPATLSFSDRFTIIHDASRVCFMQPVRAAEGAERLVAEITARIAHETLPELTRMHIVRSVADITPAVPPFVAAYLRLALGRNRGAS